MNRHPRRIALLVVACGVWWVAGNTSAITAFTRHPSPVTLHPEAELPLALTSSSAAVVTVTGGTPGKIQWGVTPAPVRQTPIGQSLITEGPAGTTYQVTAAVLMSGDVGLLSTAATIASPTTPAPGPGPEPPPGPAPAPVGTVKTWALAVFDTAQQISLPAGQLALYKSQTIAAALAPLNVVYRHYDIADPAVTGSTWGTAALKLQKPALVLWRDKAVVAGYPVNLPATEADLVTLLTKAMQ